MRLETLLRTRAFKLMVLAALSLPVLQMVTPNTAFAELGIVRTADIPTFEIKITNKYQFSSLINSDDSKKIEEVKEVESTEIDPIQLRKQMLEKYFNEIRPSTKFAQSVETLAEQPHWKKIIAIAFVESTLGRSCYYNNCWGISPGGKLAKYSSLDEGIVAHNNLIERRYSDWSYEKMNGVYVVPKNSRWVFGTKQIEAELAELEVEFSINTEVNPIDLQVAVK